jgi:hypothetical protein
MPANEQLMPKGYFFLGRSYVLRGRDIAYSIAEDIGAIPFAMTIGQ